MVLHPLCLPPPTHHHLVLPAHAHYPLHLFLLFLPPLFGCYSLTTLPYIYLPPTAHHCITYSFLYTDFSTSAPATSPTCLPHLHLDTLHIHISHLCHHTPPTTHCLPLSCLTSFIPSHCHLPATPGTCHTTQFWSTCSHQVQCLPPLTDSTYLYLPAVQYTYFYTFFMQHTPCFIISYAHLQDLHTTLPHLHTTYTCHHHSLPALPPSHCCTPLPTWTLPHYFLHLPAFLLFTTCPFLLLRSLHTCLHRFLHIYLHTHLFCLHTHLDKNTFWSCLNGFPVRSSTAVRYYLPVGLRLIHTFCFVLACRSFTPPVVLLVCSFLHTGSAFSHGSLPASISFLP